MVHQATQIITFADPIFRVIYPAALIPYDACPVPEPKPFEDKNQNRPPHLVGAGAAPGPYSEVSRQGPDRRVAIDCEREIRWTCKCLDVDIIEMAVAEDHVHLFLQYPPTLAPSRIMEAVKSNSSRHLRERYPQLVKWCKSALWAPGGFHGSVGQGFDVVERYIAGQKRAPKYNRS
ncbi:MAG: IS200/IS605 family transposase [Euryarchaeota archaeon]|nr:IS200/IS605 family transposase [Euryarchaeota archaeon]MBU4071005.1 IS200/IS605 family transposase [Candidatus Thermoplasmatota archaeon]